MIIKNKQLSNQFVVVEASAGSGKTHNLAKRYITLLLNFDLSKKENIPLKNILALTFANKASIEMRERIIEYLKKISLGENVGDLLSGLNIHQDEIIKNANYAMNFIIENYDNFNVKTIDSFINLIIKACALKIGVPPNYTIEKSYADYIDFAIDSFLDNSLINSKLENLLNDFFEQYLIDANISWDIKENISKEFIKLYEDIKKSAKQFRFNDENDYNKTLISYSEQFYNNCIEISKIKELENVDKRFINGINKIIEKNNKYYLSDGENLSVYFQREELPYKAKTRQNERLNELFNKSKQIISDFHEFKAENYYNIYMQMFRYIINEFDRQSKKDSVVFLQDLNRKVLKIFNDGSETVPEIYFQLSSYFKDFLIDEFQDTNQIQWKTLKLIVEENLSQGGSFFYVGDKKQAIYGFRGGDSRIFDQPLTEFEHYNPLKIHLDTNYRSYKAIIDFNNFVFSKENISSFFNELEKNGHLPQIYADYYQSVINMFETSRQKYCDKKKENGYVEITTVEYTDETKEERDIIIKNLLYAKLEDLKQRFDYKDITIICRDNSEIELIGKWLLEKNIDIESYQTLNIINTNIIKELFSALKFFNSPTDEISFASFILSPVFLKQTKTNKEEFIDFITENSLNKDKQKALYILFREKYPDIWNEYLEPFFNSAGFIAVYELTISVISKYNVIDNFIENNNIILRFLEVISDFEKDNQGLQSFIDYFQNIEERVKDDKFFIKVPSSNAIKIITVHKAKGLQFNVVIMPHLYLKISAPDKPFNIQDDEYIKFLNILKDSTYYSNNLKSIYYKKYVKNLSDELNILYVATTRAVYEFYGFITERTAKEKSPINTLIPENIRTLGNKISYAYEKNKDTETIDLSLTQMKDFTKIISESALEIYGQEQKELLLKGKIIHYALSKILVYNDSDVNTKIEQSINLTMLEYPNENIIWLEPILKRLLETDRIKKLFDTSNEVYNEKEFVDSSGNTIRIDKLIINKDKLIIVDFKTSVYNLETINRQMQKYLSVIREIYPDKLTECCVIDIEKNEVTEFL
ncbi:UvrD-helicase domain-containing protein [Elusimicrobiota bacterium]